MRPPLLFYTYFQERKHSLYLGQYVSYVETEKYKMNPLVTTYQSPLHKSEMSLESHWNLEDMINEKKIRWQFGYNQYFCITKKKNNMTTCMWIGSLVIMKPKIFITLYWALRCFSVHCFGLCSQQLEGEYGVTTTRKLEKEQPTNF